MNRLAVPRFLLLACILLRLSDWVLLTIGNSTQTGGHLAYRHLEHCDVQNETVRCNYIPTDIPNGTKKVHVNLDVTLTVTNVIITNETFATKNWRQLNFLRMYTGRYKVLGHFITIESYSFVHFSELQELYINIEYLGNVGRDVFVGLDNLTSLNMNNNSRLSLNDKLIPALQGNVLPRLKMFSISGLYNFGKGVDLDRSFFECLATKPIQYLDISMLEVHLFYVSYSMLLKNLAHVDSYRTKIGQLIYSDFETVFLHMLQTDLISMLLKNDTHVLQNSFSNILTTSSLSTSLQNEIPWQSMRVLNASHVVLPTRMVEFSAVLLNRHYGLSQFATKCLENLHIIDISGLLTPTSSIEFHNCSAMVDISKSWRPKVVILKNNNIKSIDIQDESRYPLVEYIDISHNSIGYVNSGVFNSSANVLYHLDLSYNLLSRMEINNKQEFEYLFAKLHQLTVLKIKDNGLTQLPWKVFEQNVKLKFLDLSDNNLEYISFQIDHLQNLKELDLSNNKITILDGSTIESITNIQQNANLNQEQIKIKIDLKLQDNPLVCNRCEAYETIKWLVETYIDDVNRQAFTCLDKSGNQVDIRRDTIDYLRHMCDGASLHLKNILIGVGVPLGVVCVVIMAMSFIIKQRRKGKRKNILNTRMHMIQQNKMDKPYLVFVSFAGDDEMFIKQHVYMQLQENLQTYIHTDRDLVCMGDRHFQVGRKINEQIEQCLDNSGSVLFLVTENFIQSVYCMTEFDFTVHLGIPVILMFKEEIPEDQMPMEMRHVFRKYTRVLWQKTEDSYELKTTWENVCESIILNMKV